MSTGACKCIRPGKQPLRPKGGGEGEKGERRVSGKDHAAPDARGPAYLPRYTRHKQTSRLLSAAALCRARGLSYREPCREPRLKKKAERDVERLKGVGKGEGES